MKTKMLLCLLGVLIIFDRSSSQPYGPLNISFGMNANYNSILNDYTYSGEQTSGNDPLYLGTGNTGTHHRAFFQWTLPQNFPTGSVVSQVQIQFSFGVNSGSPSQASKLRVLFMISPGLLTQVFFSMTSTMLLCLFFVTSRLPRHTQKYFPLVHLSSVGFNNI